MSRRAMLAFSGAVVTCGLLAMTPMAGAAVEGDYLFNDNGGTTAADSSGLNRHATLTNFANTTAGAGDAGTSGWMTNGKLKFDGTDDYVQTPVSSTLMAGTSGFTVETIFQYDGVTSRTWTPIVGSSASSSSGQIFFIGKRMNSSALNVNVAAGITTGGNYDPNLGGKALFDGNQHHLAIVYDPTAAQDVIRTYVDGTLTHTQNVSGTYSGTSDLRIGATGHSTAERWIGTVDAVRFSSGVLGPGDFIPEPGSLSAIGVAGLLLLRRRGRLALGAQGSSL